VNVIKNDSNNSLSKTLENINNTMHSANWNTSWIITFTAFYLDLEENYSAPQDNKNNSYTVTFNSLLKQLKDLKRTNFTNLVWGFDLSGIMN
ncbi:8128_t:CDS:2, partial [Diversispora eburnea]